MNNNTNGLIIDLFAGGGGASVGIEMALGRPVDIAVNHDPQAILMHKTNHPDTLHLTEDVFKIDLQKYIKGRHVALMWASPDCTSHSKAKGGKPRESGLRILPWAVYKHARVLRPDVIIMENVEEIQDWGPLDAYGQPIKERKGEDYKKFITAMKTLGYAFDCRELVAADYGAPTTRKRWYAIFRCDGKKIVFPEATYNKGGTNGLKKWVPVHMVLNVSDYGKSIFGRKKPLADNTMKRIARGLEKFVFENPEPFIVQINQSEKGFEKETPMTVPYMLRNNTGASGSNVNEPILTITTGGHHGIINPFIVPIGSGEHVAAPLLITYHSEKTPKQVRGQTVNESIKTIDTSNRYGLVSAFLTKFYKSGCGQSLFEPIHTITTSPGHFGQVSVLAVKIEELIEAGISEEVAQKCTWVSEFIIEYYGCGTGYSVNEPLRTITTKDRFALITVLGNKYVILDIYLRMLTPEELKLAQGFPKDYIIDRDYKWRAYSKAEQVKRIGNSVVPIMAQVLVEANAGYLKIRECRPAPVLDYSEAQICFV